MKEYFVRHLQQSSSNFLLSCLPSWKKKPDTTGPSVKKTILPPPSSAERSRHNTWNSLRCCPVKGGKFHLLGESL